ncbi:YdcF family protein [Aliikangiella sp. IMCC44653]
MWWEEAFRATIEVLLLPPSANFIILCLALFTFKRRPKTAGLLAGLSLLVLYILSLPVIASKLALSQQQGEVLSPALFKQITAKKAPNTAIVVISSGKIRRAPEYGEIDTVNPESLSRLMFAAEIVNKTDLPILLAGGGYPKDATPDSVLMNNVMLKYFSVAPRWIETQSQNLSELTQNTAKLLLNNNINQIVLITGPWKMPRTLQAFQKTKLKVITAPTGHFVTEDSIKTSDYFIPSASALQQSTQLLTEKLGLASLSDQF